MSQALVTFNDRSEARLDMHSEPSKLHEPCFAAGELCRQQRNRLRAGCFEAELPAHRTSVLSAQDCRAPSSRYKSAPILARSLGAISSVGQSGPSVSARARQLPVG